MSLPSQAGNADGGYVQKTGPLSPSRKQLAPVPQKPELLSHSSLLKAHNDLLTRYAALRDAYRSLLSQHQEDVSKWKMFKQTQEKITEQRKATIQAVREKKRKKREAAVMAAVKVEQEAIVEPGDVFGGFDGGKAVEDTSGRRASETGTVSGIDTTTHHHHRALQSPPPVVLGRSPPKSAPSHPMNKAVAALRPVKAVSSGLVQQDKTSTPTRQVSGSSTPSSSRLVAAGRVSPWLGGAGSSARTQKKVHKLADSFEEEYYGPSKRSFQPNPPPRQTSPPPQMKQSFPSTSTHQSGPGLVRQRSLVIPPSPTSKRKADSPPANAPNSKRTVQVDRGMLDVRTKARYDQKAEADSMKIGKEVYKGYKAKGGAAPIDDVKPAPIEQFEINPDANGGLNYAYNQTIRKKDERKKLHATDCECCSDYWKLRGHLPAPQGPIWKDPPANPPADEVSQPDEPHRDTSRHREQWAHNPTPPGYWDIGFPSTPAVDDLNQRADEIQAAKEDKIRREAKRKDGQWRKKS